MTLEESILGMRLRVMRRAEALGNVSAARREAGISRTLVYRWRRRFERYGPDGLHPRRRRARPGRPPQTPPHVERLVVGFALAWPTWGAGRLAAHLAHQDWARLAPSTVQRILRRAGLPPRRERLIVLEAHSARTAGLLTARTRRQLGRARAGRPRHIEAQGPGDLVCLDTFYLGKLKGVGPVWQLTACDATCSYRVARLLPALSDEGAAAFPREVLVPLYQRAGWPPRRPLTTAPCLHQRLCGTPPGHEPP